MFLRSLEGVASLLDKPLEQDARSALESALRYFREAAPKHTADEEESLFPRMRKLSDPDTETALSKLDALEDDHRRADSLHAEVEALGQRCLRQGHISAAEAERFRQAVAELASIYKEHIRIEDDLVFPIAGRRLSRAEKAAIAVEMAGRRNR